MNTHAYQPKTGARCACRKGVQRDNCPTCEGTGMVIDFAAIRARREPPPVNVLLLKATDEGVEIALDGTRSLFDQLYPLLDCRTIEVVSLPPGSDKHALLVDEDGRMRGLPPNPAASAIAGRVIVGDAALIARSDLR